MKVSRDAKYDPSLMVDRSTDNPYIIAILSEATEHMKFYIDVEHRLISVSFTSSILKINYIVNANRRMHSANI